MRAVKVYLIMAILSTGCATNSFEAEDCSITMGSVTFTKSLNQGKALTEQIGQNKVLIKSGAKSDYFNEPNGKANYSNAPMLLTPVNNTEPFTFLAEVTPQFAQTYDAGALYLFVHNDMWHKFAFEMDERKLTRVVTVRTMETSDDNNHDVITGPSVFMKISSDVESIGFYYSTDSVSWQLTRVYKNNFPEQIWIGISSQSPLGEGIPTLFENCSLSKKAIKDFRMGN